MSPPRRLVVNADDFGFVESVNRGIIEAMQSGVVTSASLMVNTPGTADAIRRLESLRASGGAAGIGLHFNIVVGPPLTRATTLTNPATGRFHPLPVQAWRAWRRRLDVAEFERELEAQLQRVQDLLAPLGMRVTHIDSHQHAHCLPAVFPAVTECARRHGIPHVRHPYEESPTLLGRPRAIIVARILRLVLDGVPAPDDVPFSGMALMNSPTVEADLLALVAALPAGTTELMVHPGYDSPELAAIDSYRAPRERELRALTSPALRARIRELGVELVSFAATAPAA